MILLWGRICFCLFRCCLLREPLPPRQQCPTNLGLFTVFDVGWWWHNNDIVGIGNAMTLASLNVQAIGECDVCVLAVDSLVFSVFLHEIRGQQTQKSDEPDFSGFFKMSILSSFELKNSYFG